MYGRSSNVCGMVDAAGIPFPLIHGMNLRPNGLLQRAAVTGVCELYRKASGQMDWSRWPSGISVGGREHGANPVDVDLGFPNPLEHR